MQSKVTSKNIVKKLALFVFISLNINGHVAAYANVDNCVTKCTENDPECIGTCILGNSNQNPPPVIKKPETIGPINSAQSMPSENARINTDDKNVSKITSAATPTTKTEESKNASNNTNDTQSSADSEKSTNESDTNDDNDADDQYPKFDNSSPSKTKSKDFALSDFDDSSLSITSMTQGSDVSDSSASMSNSDEINSLKPKSSNLSSNFKKSKSSSSSDDNESSTAILYDYKLLVSLSSVVGLTTILNKYY